jgi:hypothetical protein
MFDLKIIFLIAHGIRHQSNFNWKRVIVDCKKLMISFSLCKKIKKLIN